MGKYSRNMPSQFPYDQADITWTAVPIRDQFAPNQGVIPYIFSFLTSEWWGGTVNHMVQNTHDWVESRDSSKINYTLMPSTNSVFIPGPKSCILVLLDQVQVSQGQTIRIGNFDVPIFSGTQTAPIDINQIWSSWWYTENRENISQNIASVIMEHQKLLSVDDSFNIACSLTSDLYGVLHPGMSPKCDLEGNYDFKEPVDGAWLFNTGIAEHPSDLLDQKSQIKCSFIELNSKTDADRKALCGYNFGTLSSLHNPQPGTMKINNQNGTVSFTDTKPTEYISIWHASSANSSMRVAIAIGLLQTNSDYIPFPNCNGLTGWIHMLASAHSANTALFLTTNNISASDWSGFSQTFDNVARTLHIQETKNKIFSGIITHAPLHDAVQTWGNWSQEQIIDYYGIDPWEDINWLSYSPVPAHFTIQWMRKVSPELDLQGNIHPDRYYRINHKNTKHLPLTKDMCYKKLLSSATIPFEEYRPAVVNVSGPRGQFPYQTWVEQNAYISNNAVNSYNTIVNQWYLESSTITITPQNTAQFYVEEDSICIINSHSITRNNQIARFSTSNIDMPDPPEKDKIFQNKATNPLSAKNPTTDGPPKDVSIERESQAPTTQ